MTKEPDYVNVTSVAISKRELKEAVLLEYIKKAKEQKAVILHFVDFNNYEPLLMIYLD